MAQKGLQPLPYLLSPETYQACTWAYLPEAVDGQRPRTCLENGGTRDLPQTLDFHNWLGVFRASTPTFVHHALTCTSSGVPEEEREAAATAFEKTFLHVLDQLQEKPWRSDLEYPLVQPLTCLTLCSIREECLRRLGFQDVFRDVKAHENRAALQVLPSVLAELDACTGVTERWKLVLRGVFAGNIFDLGTAASAALFESGGAGAGAFAATRAKLVPRPYVVDDMDAAVQRLRSKQYKCAVMFVDNSGSDIVLGMLPLARELLRAGAKVIIAANTLPSINDITAPELGPLVQQAAQMDGVIGEGMKQGRLVVMASGNDLPVIDLRRIDPDLCKALIDSQCDLVILEGMGRAIETNLDAQLTVDCLKLGMVKHPEVALCLGGRMYDCVCRLTPGVVPQQQQEQNGDAVLEPQEVQVVA